MDITQHKVADTAAIHVKGADGTPLYDGDKPVRIIVYSPGSKAAAAVMAKQTQRAIKRMEENGGRATPPNPEDRRREDAEDLAAMTAGFENLEYPPAGKAQGVELYQALYEDASLGFIAQQVGKFVGNWSGFKPASPTS